MPFVPDAEQTAGSRFVPDVPTHTQQVGPAPTLADQLLSLIAPGGLGRLTSQADQRYGKAAYNLGDAVSQAAGKILPPAGAAALGTAANVGMQALPMLGGGEVAKGAAPVFDAAGRSLMKSAIKPLAQDLERGRVPGAVSTMLEQGYNPTEGGVAAMRAKVGEYMDQVKNILGPSTARVDITQAATNLNALKNQVGVGTLGAEKVAAIDDVLKQLSNHPSVRGGTDMAVQDAQAMKQANYKDLGNAAYGIGLKPVAERDAIKGVNAALKQGIETAEPAVIGPNAKAAELLNAIKVSQRRALIEGNKNPLSLGVSIASVAHDPMAALSLWANSSAWAKAMMARALYSGQEQIPATAARIGMGALASPSGQPPNGILSNR